MIANGTAIMKKAIDTYGKENQIVKAIEEMSELQKELCKTITCSFPRYSPVGINEEIADVEIVLEQLKMIFDNHENVEAWKEDKLSRLGRRLNRNECAGGL